MMVEPTSSSLSSSSSSSNTKWEFSKLGNASDLPNNKENYAQGCQISPDGLCVLTSTASDHILRLYNTPSRQEGPAETNPPLEQPAVLSFKEADCIRDYSWYPKMNSYDPSTCVFLSTTKEQPLHLIDAYTSELRASYLPYNDKDELSSPVCTAFSPDGTRILTAGDIQHSSARSISIFHTMIPGKQSHTWKLGKTRKSKDGQKGMISTMAMTSMIGANNIVAVGTRSPSSIYLYDDRVDQSIGEIHTFSSLDSHALVRHGKRHSRKYQKSTGMKRKRSEESVSNNTLGVTDQDENLLDFFSKAKQNWYQTNAKGTGINQLQFGKGSHNSHLLYSSARKSNTIMAWDLRMLGSSEEYTSKSLLYQINNSIPSPVTFERETCFTNQRLQFDIDHENNLLYAPTHKNCQENQNEYSIRIFNASTGEYQHEWNGFHDAPNGISVSSSSPLMKSPCVAISFGKRHFPDFENHVEDDLDDSIMNHERVGGLEFYTLMGLHEQSKEELNDIKIENIDS